MGYRRAMGRGVAVGIAKHKVVQRNPFYALGKGLIRLPGGVVALLEPNDAIEHLFGEGVHISQNFNV